MVLNFLKPNIILDINWINLKGGIYHLWAKNNRPSKFVVLQHGSYVGGIVTDIAHRYAHCDEFLTWGDYFTNYFERVNCHKSVRIKTFGNPIFNEVGRNDFDYPIKEGVKKVLIAPSAVSADRISKYIHLMNSLVRTDLEIWFKPHNLQNRLGGNFNLPEGVILYSGNNLWADFELIISDISSILLDACFFKKFVLFFMPYHAEESFNNSLYSRFMLNIAELDVGISNVENLLTLVNLQAQEDLLRYMVHKGDNRLI